MKKYYFILFFFMFVSFVFSQEIIDSLNKCPIVPPSPILERDDILTQEIEQQAEFNEGRYNKVGNYLANYIYFTEEALLNGTEGKVTIGFVIEKDGCVKYAQVSGKKLGDGLDEVVINAIMLTSGKWTPAKWNSKPVRSYFEVPITFRLP